MTPAVFAKTALEATEAAEPGATEAAKSGATEAGPAEAAEKSSTRHPCRFLSIGSIKFLDTTDSTDVNGLDGGRIVRFRRSRWPVTWSEATLGARSVG
jgi:hypothetical protein